MAKKIVKVEDTKKTKKSVNLGKIASTIMENTDAVEKIVDGISDIMNSDTKSSNKKTTKKKSTKKSANKDNLSTVIDIAEKIFKK